MPALGSLIVRLGMDIAEYTQGWDKADQKTLEVGKRIQSTMDSVQRSVATTAGNIAGALVAGFSINAFKGIISGVIETGAALDDLSQQTGSTVEALSALAAIGKFNDMSAQQIGDSMNKLSKNMAGATEESKGAAKALDALGINFDSFKKLNPEDQMQAVAKAMAQFENGTGKSAVAMALYGKEGAKMIPFLSDLAQVSELQAKMTTEQSAAAAKFDDNLVRVKSSGDGWKKEMAMGMLPAMDKGLQAFLDMSNGTGGLRDEVKKLTKDGSIAEWTTNAIKGLSYVADSVDIVIRAAIGLGKAFGGAVAASVTTVGAIGEALDKVKNKDFSGAVDSLKSGVGQVKNIVSDTYKDVASLGDRQLIGSQFRASLDKMTAGVKAAGEEADVQRPKLDFTNVLDKNKGAAAAAADAIAASIERIKAQQKEAETFTKRLVEGLGSQSRLGNVGELDYIQQVADAEIAAFDGKEQRLRQELALTARKENSLKDQEKLQGDIDAVAQARMDRQLKLGYDLLDVEGKLFDSLVKTADAERGKARTSQEAVRVAQLEGQQIGVTGAALGLLKQARVEEAAAQLEAKARTQDGIDLSGQAGDALRAQAQSIRDLAKVTGANSSAAMVQEYSRAIKESTDLIQFEQSLSGVSQQDRQIAIAQYQIAIDLKKRLAEIDAANPADAAKAAQLRADAEASASKAQAAAVARVQIDQWNQSVNEYDEIFRKGFAGMVNSGQDTWKSFTKSIVTTFKTTVADAIYKMFAQKFVVNMVGNVLGITGGALAAGSAAAGQSGGDLLSTGSSLSNVYSAASNFNTGWFSDFAGTAGSKLMGAGMSLTTKGFETAGSALMDFGDTVSKYSGALNTAGDVIGYGSAIFSAANGQWGKAIGSAVGTYFGGPIGSFVGSTVGGWLDSAFGGDAGTPHTGGLAEYSVAGGLQTSTKHGDFGMGFGGVDYSAATSTLVGDLSKSIVSILDSTAANFGKVAGYTAATAFADDSSSDGAWGGLLIKSMDKILVNWDDSRQSKWAPKEFADGEAGQKEYLAAVAGSVRTALDAVGLPSWATRMLENLGNAPSLEQLASAVDQINAVQKVLGDMGKVIGGMAGLGDGAVATLISVSGGISGLATNASSFVENFFSEGEKTAIQSRRIADTLATVNLTMPTTREEFRALLDQQLALGDSGAAAAAVLLGVNSAFADLVPELESVILSVKDLKAAQKSLNDELFQATHAGNTRALRDKERADLMAQDPTGSLVGIKNKIYAQQDADAIASGMKGFTSNFMSVAEQQAAGWDDIGKTFGRLGIAMPTTKEGFRDLVLGMDDTTEAGRLAKLAVLGVGDSFSGLVDAAETARKAADDAKKAADDAAAQAKKVAIDTALQSITRSVEAARTAENTSYQKQVSGVTESISRLTSLTGKLRGTLDGFSPAGSEVEMRSAAQAQITAALQQARAGGAGGIDQDRLSAALSTVSKDAASQFGSRAAYALDYADTVNGIAELASLTDASKTAAEQQLGALNANHAAELARLDGIMAASQALVDAENGVINAVVSVEEAVRSLGAALGRPASVTDPAGVVSGLYKGLFSRDADAGGAAYWQTLLTLGSSVSDITAGMMQSDEYRGLHGSHADGLAYVPFDGYRAELHRGERVLTASENRVYGAPAVGQGSGNAELIAEIRALREESRAQRTELEGLRYEARATAGHTAATKKILDRVTQGGSAMAIVPDTTTQTTTQTTTETA